jgi:hypothetical protein
MLDIAATDVDAWIDDLTRESAGDLISIEIVPGEELLAPPADSDPWALPPHKRIAPPVLDRAALMGRRSRQVVRSRDGNDGNDGNGDSVSGNGGSEWALRRQAWRDQRRIRREMAAERRHARVEEAQTAARQVEQQARQIRTGPLPMAVPGSLAAQVAAPAGAVNTGSVFPVPDTRRQSEMVTYHSVEGAGSSDDRIMYATRVLLTVAVLVGLAGLLWWAVGAFGEGLSSVLDLFRGEETDPDPAIGALRLMGWS